MKMGAKKSFFYIPTWVLILLCILSLGTTLFELFMLFNFSLFETLPMSIDSVSIRPGTQEYEDVTKIAKQALGVSAIFSLLFFSVFAYLIFRRKTSTKNDN